MISNEKRKKKKKRKNSKKERIFMTKTSWQQVFVNESKGLT